jgi:PKD repeat protein
MKASVATGARALLAALLSVLVGVGALATPAGADTAPPAPATPVNPVTVSADALPTVQINGVAWAQVVVGNTVYVAGRFTSARPAGARAGTSETPRNNLLAYDVRTGELITSFAPSLNQQALALAASPDGRRLYVGGDFTQADGQARYRVAAYDTATGQLVSTFRPAVNAQVRAIAATDTTVYVGGTLTAVGSTARNRLAAFRASDGALLPWAPQPGVGSTAGNKDGNTATSNQVMAMVLAGPSGQVVVGGRFDTLNGTKATGVGALDGVTGATRPFAANRYITNQGVNSAVYSLSSDGTNVYGTAYDYYGPGSLEGTFVARADGGGVVWFADCRGDTYSVFPAGGVVYTASHAHDCANIGSFTETTPRTHWYANAYSLAPHGTNSTANNWNGGRLAGQPSPAHLAWQPAFDAGSVTGQYQAAWSVAANADYVVYGGEFPYAGGRAQQGLVRFAVPRIAPNRSGPVTTPPAPTATPIQGAVRLSWPATWDRDNESLTYRVYRDATGTTPACEVTAPTRAWRLPTLACSDTSATAGSHRYQVTVSDAFGNRVSSAWTTVTVPASSSGTRARAYEQVVAGDGAVAHWPLGESSGTTAFDHSGTADGTLNAGVTRGAAGAIAGDRDTAYRFSGTSTGHLTATAAAAPGPQVFSVEAWFQTTTTNGGKIVGYGNARTGTSTAYDRHLYMDAQGRVLFGVRNGTNRTVSSTAALNDGRWHHVVGTLGRAGMSLYVDGRLVATDPAVVSASAFTGYWRIGGDKSWATGLDWFAGQVDEVAVYPTVLPAATVAEHHLVGTSGTVPNTAPTAAFTAAVNGLAVAVDGSGSADAEGPLTTYRWDFGNGTTGTGATASHTYAAAGTYTVRLTVTDAAGATATATRSVTVTAPPAPEPPATGVVARDAFGREVTGGWGAADLGGTWTVVGSTAAATVTGGSGRISAAVGGTSAATLPVPVRDADVRADVVVEKAPTGGGSFVSVVSRSAGAERYTTQLRYSATGSVTASLTRVSGGAETVLGSYRLPANYTPGTVLEVRFATEGTGTTTLRAKVWPAGTAEPAAWQVTATDTTAVLQRAGAVRVDLYHSSTATTAQTVRLDDLQVVDTGAPAAPANTAPTAAFTSSVSGLTVAVDGSGSADAEGPLTGHAWDFGDGTTGTGATATRTYAAAGTYTVRLTVTDAAGATGTVTRAVTVTAPAPEPETPEPPADTALARDAFGRTVTGGWGTADRGGAWVIGGSAANATVADGSGRLAAAAGAGINAQLPFSAQDVALQAGVVLQQAPTGGGSYVTLVSRNGAGSTRYGLQLRYSATGSVTATLVRTVNGAETALGAYRLPTTHTPGTVLTVRFETAGAGTTALRAKVWAAGTAEPADWQVQATDTTAALQRAGTVRVDLYQSANATSTQAVRVDDLWAGPAGTTP